MPSPPDESFVLTEEPDLLVGHFIGRVTADDIARMFDVQLRFSEGKPHIFLLADVSRMIHITHEARRVAAQGPGGKGEPVPILGCGFIGASFHVRALGTMLLRAARLLRRTSAFPIRFFDTEADARAWLDERRRELGLPR